MNCRLPVLFSILCYSCFSQVPGYMGKRFSIGYANYFMVSGIGPVANASSTETQVGINTTHCFNIDYSIKNRTNFCVSIQTAKMGVYTSKVYYSNSYNIYGYHYNTSSHYSPSPFVPMQLRTINLGLAFKFFKRGTFAPIGKYKKLELLLLFSHLTYAPNSFMEEDGTGSRVISKGSGSYAFNTFAITYTIGRSRVLFDRLVLDYGLRIGALPAGFFAYLSGNDFLIFTNNRQDDFDSSMKQETNKRLFREQLVNFHIGIGFLAF